MGRFKFFAAIVALVTVLTVSFFATFYLLKKYTNVLSKPLMDGKTLVRAGGVHELLKLKGSSLWILCGFRILFFFWFALFNTVYRMFFFHPRGWHYYTNWNIYLLGFYYTFSSTSTILLMKKEKYSLSEKETVYAEYVAAVASVLYTVAGSAAIMITGLNFLLLNPEPTFWNLTLHLSTTLSLLIDMSLNDMAVNRQDVLFSIIWPYCYLVFIWPIVKESVRGEWPYFFVETQNASSFFWYLFLYVMSFLFFVAFYFLHRGKDKLIMRIQRKVNVSEHQTVPVHDVAVEPGDSFHSVDGL